MSIKKKKKAASSKGAAKRKASIVPRAIDRAHSSIKGAPMEVVERALKDVSAAFPIRGHEYAETPSTQSAALVASDATGSVLRQSQFGAPGVAPLGDISMLTLEEHKARFTGLCAEIGRCAGKIAHYFLEIGQKLGDAKRHHDLLTRGGRGTREAKQVSSFAEAVAAESGLTCRTIQLYIQVGKLDDAAKAEIARTPQATFRDLIRLARVRPEKQLAAARALSEDGREAFNDIVAVPRRQKDPVDEAGSVPESTSRPYASLPMGNAVPGFSPVAHGSMDVYTTFAITPDSPPVSVSSGEYIVQIRIDSVTDGQVLGNLCVKRGSFSGADAGAADLEVLAEAARST